MGNFFPVDRHVTGRFDPYAHLVAPYSQHDDLNVIANTDRLADFARQDQHGFALETAGV